MAYEEVKMAERIDQERLLRERRMPTLKRLVRPYQHDALLPALASIPVSVHGPRVTSVQRAAEVRAEAEGRASPYNKPKT
jgi:hypothetical protein